MKLSDDELDVIPRGQITASHAHCVHDAVMAGFLQAVLGVGLDLLDMRLDRIAVHVGVKAEIAVALERLRMFGFPRGHLVGIDEDLPVFDPASEFLQNFMVVVFTDAGIEAVIPMMQPAHQIVAIDIAVREQRAAMQAAAIEHGDLFAIAYDDEIDAADQRVGRFSVFKLIPDGDGF